MRISTFYRVLVLLCLVHSAQLKAQTIFYVKQTASGNGSGSSWANAANGANLQTVIDTSTIPKDIWVAAGTYKPNSFPHNSTGSPNARYYAFRLKKNTGIYGGFAGTETALDERNIPDNPTILSGDIGIQLDASDNCLHVIISVGDDSTSILDGVIVQDGVANIAVTTIPVDGVPVYSQMGGNIAMYNSAALIRNSIIRTGYSLYRGGGVSAYTSDPSFVNCVFPGNFGHDGGGVWLGWSTGSFTNCIFYQNSSVTGGGLSSDLSHPHFTNCTFAGNAASNGGAYTNDQGFPVVTNCILYGNANTGNNEVSPGSSIVSHSILQSGWPGTAVKIADPQFVNIADGDGPDNKWFTADDGLRLTPGSPAMDAGTASGAPAKDILGLDRPQGSNPDMGTYELPVCTGMPASGSIVVNSPVCKNELFTMSLSGSEATPGISYQWRQAPINFSGAYSDIQNSNSNPLTIPTSPLVLTFYRCIVTCTASGLSTTTDPIYVIGNPAPTPSITGSPIFCGEVTLETGSYVSYRWSDNSTGQTLTAITPGSYSVNVTDTNGCHGQASITLVDARTPWYADADGDGYGDAAMDSLSCVPMDGYVTNNEDCNDADAAINAPLSYYLDADGDGYGSATTALVCAAVAPAGYSSNSDDCNDAEAAIHPLALEICGNGIDENCNGMEDDECVPCTKAPARPAMITQSGITGKVCPGETRIYTIPPVANCDYYLWTLPTGSTVVAGQGTTDITLSFNATMLPSSLLEVAAVNTCGTSIARTQKIIRNSRPGTPSAINGPKTGVCTMTAVNYAVTELDGMSYSWSTDQPGVLFNGPTDAATTAVSYPAGFISGNIMVTATNGCGTSNPRKLFINGRPATPVSIIGPAIVCTDETNVAYAIEEIEGALEYTWTAPNGAIISDGLASSVKNVLTTSSNEVMISFGEASGVVKVRAVNDCGVGGVLNLPVSVGCSGPIPKQTLTEEDMTVQVYPNPAKGQVYIRLEAAEQGSYSIDLYDALGRRLKKQELIPAAGAGETSLDVSALSPGVYHISVRGPGTEYSQSIVVE